ITTSTLSLHDALPIYATQTDLGLDGLRDGQRRPCGYVGRRLYRRPGRAWPHGLHAELRALPWRRSFGHVRDSAAGGTLHALLVRSEEHTSELQSQSIS